MFWILLAVLAVVLIVVLSILKGQYENETKRKLVELERELKEGYFDPADIEKYKLSRVFPFPNAVRMALIGLAFAFFILGTFNNIFFYAEPGYKYHVRTILGQERVIDDVGYAMHLFGRKNAWKKAMTVVADDTTRDGVNAEGEASVASASLPPQNIMFLDQVDGDA